jgi:hypothetical protein
MRIIITAFILVLATSPALAGTCTSPSTCTGSNPWTANSNSYADVNYCVNTCSAAGDTVNVPPGTGSVTWSSILNVTRGKTIVGPGVANLTVTAGVATIVAYTPSATAATNNEAFDLSGFTFSGGSMSLGSNAVYLNHNGSEVAMTKVRIHNNIFSGAGITTRGDIFGVADNNTFSGSDRYFYYSGNGDASRGSSGCGSWIVNTRTPGSGNNFYYEDNIINLTSGTELAAYGQGYGGGIVHRYNTWASLSQYTWDAHGNQTTTGTSSQTMEVYGNNVAINGTNNILTDWRGGHIWMYFNHFTNGNTGTFRTRNEHCNSIQNCTPTINQYISDTYLFRNYNNSTLMVPTTSDTSGCNEIAWDVTEWKDVTSFTGASGVGCGTLANRPITCTTGVGYWATNQSCTSMTGMVGVNPSTPISGTLYKCTAANTWTAHYTPYMYPHPLRTGGDTTSPVTAFEISSPQNISEDNLAIFGTSSDAEGVTACYWNFNSAVDITHGTLLTGTTSWSGTVTGFASGANTLYVGCRDAAGNFGNAAITVNYTEPQPEGVAATCKGCTSLKLGAGGGIK